MQHLEQVDKDSMILLVDFEKAFDSVEWPYINKLLRSYNFGNDILNWFSTMYSEPESCVINNGHFSNFFRLERGCRQGDPLSPYIFILAIEPLAMALKNDNEIQGITMGDKVHKVGQYADDTFLMLKGDERSLRKSIDTFNNFLYLCGAKGKH